MQDPDLPVRVGRSTGSSFRARWEVFPGRCRLTNLHGPVTCRHLPLNIRAGATARIPRPLAGPWCPNPWRGASNNMATAVLKEQLQATCGEVDRACELLTSPSAE